MQHLPSVVWTGTAGLLMYNFFPLTILITQVYHFLGKEYNVILDLGNIAQ